jgi:glycolate oxidase iron-sulfur subunit
MQTKIHPDLKAIPLVSEAESILRSCVHCGFCTAVCPTYQELGDDLDSPRGRIYLIKGMLETDDFNSEMNQHLDRCLTCRSCETTCPSGVQYGRLLDIGKHLVETRYQPERNGLRNMKAALLRFLLPRPGLFGLLYGIGKWFRPVLPISLRNKMPVSSVPVLPQAASVANNRKVLVLQGCVQRALTPGVNRALEHLLAEHKISVSYMSEEGCCGAVDYHLGFHDAGIQRICELVDRLDAELEDVEFVVSTASGCGVTIKDYPKILADLPDYLVKAERIAAKVCDVSELVATLEFKCQPLNVAIHSPCTLQHGQKLPKILDEILQQAGANLVPVSEAHLCCGSAGTYSVLEPELSERLGRRKLACLTEHAPDLIVTANVGCQTQLSAYAETPVMHWVEFLAHYRTT